MTDATLNDEAGRLLALQRYGVLDTGRDRNFDAITGLVREVLGVNICGISLIDADRQWFKSVAGDEALRETPREDAFCHFAIQSRDAFVVKDARSDERFRNNPLVTGDPFISSYAGVPLRSPEGYNLGALCVIDSEPRVFIPSELALLARFSRLVVDQLELRTLAHRDSLTDALTRRAFSEAGRDAFSQFEQDGQPSALILLDIDHFKGVNDTFGHAVGDQVLRAVSALCRDLLRPGDLFGRLGGEEFAIIAPGSSNGDAFMCAERLRRAIEALREPGCPPVTASFGVAPWRRGADLDLAMAEADAALYAAKRRGRNRTLLSSGTFELAA